MVAIRDVDEQAPDDLFVFRGGGEVHWLVHVVRRRVIALSQPVFKEFLLGRSWFWGHAHNHRRDAVADEVVKIAAHEKIAQRLGVRLDLYAARLRDFADAIAEVGVVQTKHGEKFRSEEHTS